MTAVGRVWDEQGTLLTVIPAQWLVLAGSGVSVGASLINLEHKQCC